MNCELIADVVETFHETSLQTPQMSLIVTVYCSVAERQPRERELQGGSVPIDRLRRDVQEEVVPFLILIIQRAIRHKEEVPRGQTERVCGRGGDNGAGLRYGHSGGYGAFSSYTLTFNMIKLAINHYTTRTVVAIMPCIKYKERSAFLAARFYGNNPVLPDWWSILLLTSGCGERHYPNG